MADTLTFKDGTFRGAMAPTTRHTRGVPTRSYHTGEPLAADQPMPGRPHALADLSQPTLALAHVSANDSPVVQDTGYDHDNTTRLKAAYFPQDWEIRIWTDAGGGWSLVRAVDLFQTGSTDLINGAISGWRFAPDAVAVHYGVIFVQCSRINTSTGDIHGLDTFTSQDGGATWTRVLGHNVNGTAVSTASGQATGTDHLVGATVRGNHWSQYSAHSPYSREDWPSKLLVTWCNYVQGNPTDNWLQAGMIGMTRSTETGQWTIGDSRLVLDSALSWADPPGGTMHLHSTGPFMHRLESEGWASIASLNGDNSLWDGIQLSTIEGFTGIDDFFTTYDTAGTVTHNSKWEGGWLTAGTDGIEGGQWVGCAPGVSLDQLLIGADGQHTAMAILHGPTSLDDAKNGDQTARLERLEWGCGIGNGNNQPYNFRVKCQHPHLRDKWVSSYHNHSQTHGGLMVSSDTRHWAYMLGEQAVHQIPEVASSGLHKSADFTFTASTNTFTSVAHGLSVGDYLHLAGANVPKMPEVPGTTINAVGRTLEVTAVPDADTFQLGFVQGAPQTFTVDGSGTFHRAYSGVFNQPMLAGDEVLFYYAGIGFFRIPVGNITVRETVAIHPGGDSIIKAADYATLGTPPTGVTRTEITRTKTVRYLEDPVSGERINADMWFDYWTDGANTIVTPACPAMIDTAWVVEDTGAETSANSNHHNIQWQLNTDAVPDNIGVIQAAFLPLVGVASPSTQTNSSDTSATALQIQGGGWGVINHLNQHLSNGGFAVVHRLRNRGPGHPQHKQAYIFGLTHAAVGSYDYPYPTAPDATNAANPTDLRAAANLTGNWAVRSVGFVPQSAPDYQTAQFDITWSMPVLTCYVDASNYVLVELLYDHAKLTVVKGGVTQTATTPTFSIRPQGDRDYRAVVRRDGDTTRLQVLTGGWGGAECVVSQSIAGEAALVVGDAANNTVPSVEWAETAVAGPGDSGFITTADPLSLDNTRNSTLHRPVSSPLSLLES